jgi:acetyl-CoA carboxylase biotin carboxyl carrier protein
MGLEVTARLTASVVRTTAEVGQVVEEGATLLLVESMKMEIPVNAPRPGRVAEVRVGAGDVIAEGDVLVVLQELDRRDGAAEHR